MDTAPRVSVVLTDPETAELCRTAAGGPSLTEIVVAGTKAAGARRARGDVLVFLDAGAEPRGEALTLLVRGVRALQGEAVLIPALAGPDVLVHGYGLELRTMETRPLAPEELMPAGEPPALTGGALALTLDLYRRLRGHDPGMSPWGVEDLDLGLTAWMLGHPIVSDAAAVVGRRPRRHAAPADQILADRIRLAYKHLTHGVWSEWLERTRERYPDREPDHPEGLWARAWRRFKHGRPGVEDDRAFIMARRVRDEFDYADRAGLTWPRLRPWPAP